MAALDEAVLHDLFQDPQALRGVDEKGHLPDALRDAVMRKCRMKSENRSCFECAARNPTWCSVSFGVYLCLDCSGEHRRKGVHISFVRSVDMDKFYPDQLVQMAIGGNAKAWNFFKECGMGKTSSLGKPIAWQSRPAEKYKSELEAAMKAACAKLGVPDVVDRAKGGEPMGPGAAPAAADAAPADGAADEGAAAAVAAPGASPEAVKFVCGERIQFREKGGFWKWGFITHAKPLKVDFAARDEPTNKVAKELEVDLDDFFGDKPKSSPSAVKPGDPAATPLAVAPVTSNGHEQGAKTPKEPEKPSGQMGVENDFDFDF